MRSTASPIAIWAGILTLWVVWGTTYLGIRLAVDTIPPFIMVAARFGTAGLLLVAFVAIRERGDLRPPSRVELRDSLILGGRARQCGESVGGPRADRALTWSPSRP